MSKRNIEEIRRKNLEDNQLFLNQLRIKNIQNDFLESARSVLGKDEPKKKPYKYIHYEKVERVTRYSLKVKSGEIPPFTPHWQQKKPKDEPSKWTVFYAENGNPYQRVYEPRRTKIGERIKNECIEYSKEKH